MPTRSAFSGRQAPLISAAKAAAPPGSATIETFAPEAPLGFDDRRVGHERDLGDMPARDGEVPFADPSCAERIGGDRLDRDVDRAAGFERRMQRARTFRLDADDLDPSGEPGGDAGDQPAAADRDEHRVERRQGEALKVLLPFEGDRAGAGDRLGRVVGVDFERAAFGDVSVAKLLRLGVGSARNDGLGAVGADPRDLRRGRDFRHEHPRRNAELLRRIGDRRAVVAARGGGAAGCRGRAGQQGCGTPRAP